MIEDLDGAVEAAYREAGLNYRPRYTPIVRTLAAGGPASIRALADAAGVSHSAASQTVSQMRRDGLVELEAGRDGRERIVVLTRKAADLLPTLENFWTRTAAAADQLDGELSAPLSRVLMEAITALEREPFGDRIARQAASPAPDVEQA